MNVGNQRGKDEKVKKKSWVSVSDKESWMGDTEIRDEKLLWVAVRVRTASLLYDDESKGWAGVTTKGSGLDFLIFLPYLRAVLMCMQGLWRNDLRTNFLPR